MYVLCTSRALLIGNGLAWNIGCAATQNCTAEQSIHQALGRAPTELPTHWAFIHFNGNEGTTA